MQKKFKYVLTLILPFMTSLAMWQGWIEAIYNSSYYYRIFGFFDGHGAENILINIFFVLAGFLFIVALIVAFFAAIRLFISSNSSEDFSKWSNTLIWSVAGLLLVSLSYGFIMILNRNVLANWAGFTVRTVYNTTIDIIYPILNFLRYIAAICFFLVIVYAFYRIIFAGWDEEGFQSGKRTFIAATLGFIIMLLAEPIVRMSYGWDNCNGDKLFWIPTWCVDRTFDAGIFLDTSIKIIIFLNWFIALVTVIMIMYAGFLVLTGGWDEEKSEKAKKIILYAIIGVLIILFSYVIYRALLFNIA